MFRLESLPTALLRHPGLTGSASVSRLLPTGYRSFSTSDPDPPRVYVSTSTDPWFNLAFEDWLYRKSPPSIPMLFMYRNRDCVVLGRNQNPWKEVNLPLLESKGVPFVRRRSGGGTVYHDLGNTNYSILIPKDTFSRRPNALLVARALQSLSVPAEVNDRNDIILDGFKISGSAYKLNNRRAYHHGTMLISARLAELGHSLRSEREFTTNKGTASVPSPVQNITTHHPDVDHSSFVNAVVKEFVAAYGDGGRGVREISEATLQPGEEKDQVEKEAADLKSWDWAYGQTPEFSVTLSIPSPLLPAPSLADLTTTITSKHGLITALDFSGPVEEEERKRLESALIRTHFGGEADSEDSLEGWLRRNM